MVDPVWSWQPQAWVSPHMHGSQLLAPGLSSTLGPPLSSTLAPPLPLAAAQAAGTCPSQGLRRIFSVLGARWTGIRGRPTAQPPLHSPPPSLSPWLLPKRIRTFAGRSRAAVWGDPEARPGALSGASCFALI